MTRTTDVLVVGGGIAGLCTALALVERHLRVIVVDERRPGAASRAAAGLLAPSLEGLSAKVYAAAIEARDAYPDFLAQLRERTGVDVALDRNGIMELATSEAELGVLVARSNQWAQRLGSGDLARLEPSFSGHAGAVLHPHDGAVDNVALMRALVVAVESDSSIERLADRVSSFDFAAPRPVAHTATGERIESAFTVLASGAWGTDIPGLPRALPVRPVRGELLMLDTLPIRHVTYGAGGYLVPRGGQLLIGATSDESGFQSHTTDAGRASLLGIAERAVPALAGARVTDHWAGLRPVTPDGLPVLGFDPEVPALAYACGFSRNGILLAPWSATQLAGLLSGGVPEGALAPFAPDRFDVQE